MEHVTKADFNGVNLSPHAQETIKQLNLTEQDLHDLMRAFINTFD